MQTVRVDPLYVKHSALRAKRYERHVQYKLCWAASNVVPGEVLGAQQIEGLWLIFVTSNTARNTLLNEGILMDTRSVKLHNTDPFTLEDIPSEKIIFKDLPLTYTNESLLNRIKELRPNLILRSDIISHKVRDEHNNDTEFLSGDRHMYVQTDFSPVFPEEIKFSGNPCRVWHYTQENVCRRCKEEGHRAFNTDQCPAFIDSPIDNITFFSQSSDPLCNFYQCNIRIYGEKFRSSEAAYQWAKMRFIGRYDYAHDIMRSSSAVQAKNISKRIPGWQLEDWHKQKKTK